MSNSNDKNSNQQIDGFEMSGHDIEGGNEEDDEKSVYINGNVVMRRIQIEGED